MTDKYDLAVAYLTAHPEEILGVWNNPWDHEAGCLFYPCCKEKSYRYGCLTQVKYGSYIAQAYTLTQAIRADDSIPTDPKDITIPMLGPVFAAWQRRIDVELDRT